MKIIENNIKNNVERSLLFKNLPKKALHNKDLYLKLGNLNFYTFKISNNLMNLIVN